MRASSSSGYEVRVLIKIKYFHGLIREILEHPVHLVLELLGELASNCTILHPSGAEGGVVTTLSIRFIGASQAQGK